jgi:phage terminase large subunit-like protein
VTDNRSLRQIIEALPEDEYAVRRALFTDEEWDSWELNAYPWQLPPQDPEWQTWVTKGPRAIGHTRTGIEWVSSLISGGEPAKVLGVLPNHSFLQFIRSELMHRFRDDSRIQLSIISGASGVINTQTGARLWMFAENLPPAGAQAFLFTHAWADEVKNPMLVASIAPHARKYLFTNPHTATFASNAYMSSPSTGRA